MGSSRRVSFDGRSKFDPEDHARPFALAGLIAVLVGVRLGGWWDLLVPLGLASLSAACWSRRDGFLLLGPVARAEMVRAARLGRALLWRSLFVAALLAGLCLTYAARFDVGVGDFLRGTLPPVPARETARLAGDLAITFLALQAFVVLVATARIASRIADDVRGRNFELLLATDLRSREIVMGKVAGGLAWVLLFVLAGLPVLALLPLFGGVDPGLLLAVTAATLVTALGVAGFAVALSIDETNSFAAWWATLSSFAAYLMFTGGCLLCLSDLGWADFPFGSPVTLRNLIETVTAGNPLAVGYLMSAEVARGAAFDDILPHYARCYVVFWLGVFGVFGLGGVVRLRAAGVREPKTPPPRPKAAATRDRPPVWERPVLWMELNVGPHAEWLIMKAGRRTWTATVLLPIVGMAAILFWIVDGGRFLHAILVGAAAIGIPMTGINGGLAAAGSLAREREKGTLDGLLLTRLTPTQILTEKWLAAMTPGLTLIAWATTQWAAAAAIGVIHPLAVVVLPLASLVVIGFLVTLGLERGSRASTVGRAEARYLLAILGMLFAVVAAAVGAAGIGARHSDLILGGFLPPVTLGVATFDSAMLDESRAGSHSVVAWVAAGLTTYAVLGWLLWARARGRASET